LLNEFRAEPDAFLHPLQVHFQEYTASLDFDTVFKRYEAKKVLLQLAPIQIDSWMEELVTGSPIFFKCSEELAQKMATAYATWLESRSGGYEGFVIGRWWTNMLKSRRATKVELDENVDPVIRDFVNGLADEFNKWTFAKRIALLLDAFLSITDGVRLVDNALRQLQESQSYDVLIYILVYFTQRGGVDVLSWIKVVLDRGEPIDKARALHLLATMAEETGGAGSAILDEIGSWQPRANYSGYDAYSAATLLPRVLVFRSCQGLFGNKDKTAEAVVPFLDSSETSSISSNAEKAMGLTTRQLSEDVDAADAQQALAWIEAKWLKEFSPTLSSHRRAAILAKLNQHLSCISPQRHSAFSHSVMMVEALALFLGVRPWNERREKAAGTLVNLFSGRFDARGNREIYSCLHALCLQLRDLNDAELKSRKMAARLLFDFFVRHYR